jgi:hypothetical protein
MQDRLVKDCEIELLVYTVHAAIYVEWPNHGTSNWKSFAYIINNVIALYQIEQ